MPGSDGRPRQLQELQRGVTTPARSARVRACTPPVLRCENAHNFSATVATEVQLHAKTRMECVQLCNTELQSCKNCLATLKGDGGAGKEGGSEIRVASRAPSAKRGAIRYRDRHDTHPRPPSVLTFTPCLRAGPYTGASTQPRRTPPKHRGSGGGRRLTDTLPDVRVRKNVARSPGRGGRRPAAPRQRVPPPHAVGRRQATATTLTGPD